MSGCSVTDFGEGATEWYEATCNYCLKQWRVDINRLNLRTLAGVSIDDAKKRCTCCPKCALFIKRWPNNTCVYPLQQPIHEKEVAEFAATKRDASWLVWIINKNRKKSNSRSALKRRIAKERKGAEHASCRVPHPQRQKKLLSFNKTMELCEQLGKK